MKLCATIGWITLAVLMYTVFAVEYSVGAAGIAYGPPILVRTMAKF